MAQQTSDSLAGQAKGGLSPFKAALLVGLGIGGLADVVLLHGILGWHRFLATAGASTGSRWTEAVFLAVSLACFLVGLRASWAHRAAWRGPETRRDGLAGVLAGWGAFNLGEGLVAHQLLGLHHVRPGPDQAAFDAVYLVWGAGLLALGVALRSVTLSERHRLAVRHRRTV